MDKTKLFQFLSSYCDLRTVFIDHMNSVQLFNGVLMKAMKSGFMYVQNYFI